MSTIKIMAGDLDTGAWDFVGMFGVAVMTKAITRDNPATGERYSFQRDVESVDALDSDRVKKLGGTLGWGVAGGAILGPLGAIGGMLLGGNKKEVTFTGILKDGRKFMAVTDDKTWKKILAAMFTAATSSRSLTES